MKSTAERLLTISVDDGHPDDLQTADLLDKYDLAATFYIPARNPERPLMPEAEVRHLGERFEIGAHTLNHRPLRGLRVNELEEEVQGGKQWLEQLLGREATSFCYPKGKYDTAALQAVGRAGFVGARTCRYNLIGFPNHPQCWGLSTHAYSHSRSIQIRHALLERNLLGIVNYLGMYRAAVDWVRHFELAVERVQQQGGVAHLYFHSWEITATGQWRRLEELFRKLVDSGLQRITNSELFRKWHERKAA
ncbi:MAG: polysaccharide deacetylase family protein [Planctomycetales bacterium]|nr:polysaccharide deacetylase family protein [Planctomycetales bacterium]